MLSLGNAVATTVAAVTSSTIVLPLLESGETPRYVYVAFRQALLTAVTILHVKPFHSLGSVPNDANLMPILLAEPVILFTGGCDRMRVRNTSTLTSVVVTITPLENV